MLGVTAGGARAPVPPPGWIRPWEAQTDSWTKRSPCAAMLCIRHKNTTNLFQEQPLFYMDSILLLTASLLEVRQLLDRDVWVPGIAYF